MNAMKPTILLSKMCFSRRSFPEYQITKSIYLFLWVTFLLLIQGMNTPCIATGNKIFGVSIVSETINEIIVEIKYSYSGDHGQTAFASVVMADKDKSINYFSYRPGRINRGTGRTRVTLGVTSSAPASFTSSQLQVKMYGKDGESFREGMFNFSKTWLKPGTFLHPVIKLVAPIPATFAAIVATPAKPTTVKMRTIMPNGNVLLRYHNGAKKRLFKGGYELTAPQGSSKTHLFSSSQFPTPPSVPPDNSHAMWLLHENNQLLRIIESLVGNDEASIKNYMDKEAGKNSYYEQITSRTLTINQLISP